MFGAFRASSIAASGLLWKNPYRMSTTRKARVRQRLRSQDAVVEAVQASGVELHSLAKALALPKENEMQAKDKYTVFSRRSRGYRKSLHKVPKFTRIIQRTNPAGY